MESLSIGGVSRATGLSIDTIRFYESEGLLLDTVARSSGGRRLFTQEHVQWLTMCHQLRRSGMPIADMKRLAELIRGGSGNERERLDILIGHQRALKGQLAELNEALQVVTAKVSTYRTMLDSEPEDMPLWPES